jgi:hypothetical protein
MPDDLREAYRVLLDLEWEKLQADYEEAGRPFGEGRGLDLWVHYGTNTTVN